MRELLKTLKHAAEGFLPGSKSKDVNSKKNTDNAEYAINKSERASDRDHLSAPIRWFNLEQEIVCMLGCGGYGTPQRNLICSKCRLLISADINAAKKAKRKFSERTHNRVIEERLLASLSELPKSLADQISMQTEDAIGEIFEIVPNLSAKSYSFEDISVRVQLLYEEITELVSVFPTNTKSKSKISVKEILRLVEECVCIRTYPILFCMSEAEKAAEVAHRDWIRSWSSVKNKCLPSEISFDSANFQAYMQDAGRALSEMNSFCTPTEKIECIERCVNCVYLAIRENSEQSFLVSSDALVAALIYTILQENPDLLQANLEFIGKFGQIHAVGYQATGYSFTLICVAMHFVIDGIADTSLSKLMDDSEKTTISRISFKDKRIFQELGNVKGARKKGKKVEGKLLQGAASVQNSLSTKEQLIIGDNADRKVPQSDRFEVLRQQKPSTTEKEILKSEESSKRMPHATAIDTSANLKQPLKVMQNSATTTSEEKLQMSRNYNSPKSDASISPQSKNAEFTTEPIPKIQHKIVLPTLEISPKITPEKRASNSSATGEANAELLKMRIPPKKSEIDKKMNMPHNLSNTERTIQDLSQEVATAKRSSKLVESATRSQGDAALLSQVSSLGSGGESSTDRYDVSEKQDKFSAAKYVKKEVPVIKPDLKDNTIPKAEVQTKRDNVPDNSVRNSSLNSDNKNDTSSKPHNMSSSNKISKDAVVPKEIASTKAPAKLVEASVMPRSDAALMKTSDDVPDSGVRNQPKLSSDEDVTLKKIDSGRKRTTDDEEPKQSAPEVAATDAKRRQFMRAPSFKFTPAAPPTWSVAPPENSLESPKTVAVTSASAAATITPTAATASIVPTINATAVAAALASSSAVAPQTESLPSWRPIAMRKESKSDLANQENSQTLAFAREFLTKPKNMIDITQDRNRADVPVTVQPQNRFVTEDLAGIDPKLLIEQALKFSEARIAQEKLRQAEQASKGESNHSQSTTDTSKGMMEYLMATKDTPVKKTKIVIKAAANETSTIDGKQMSPKEALLRWCQIKTNSYPINITNFSGSWADGMAFCALVHHFRPNAFDFTQLNPQDRRRNFELAFHVAEKQGIDRLLEVDDMIFMGDKPDWKCVFTYVQAIFRRFRNEN